ncbi:unnamed protein product [Anisakis simplex]|uniref:Ubiquitin carboxyl-terminal hydrolase n=1 Tax=Anisakis simplex TaxID=6269 RepID=A0A158PN45_ANISI|nr:unnamed protein product [Anisakis simplex]
MDGLSGQTLSVKEANALMERVQNDPLVIDEKWNLISMEWWKSFTACVEKGDTVSIAPIDNEVLLDRTKNGTFTLKKNLLERADFILVPSMVFDRLSEVYGVVSKERDTITRRVTFSFPTHQSLRVEIYPSTIRVFYHERMIWITVTPWSFLQMTLLYHIYDADGHKPLTGKNWEDAFACDALIVVDIVDEHGHGLVGSKQPNNRDGSEVIMKSGKELRAEDSLERHAFKPGVCGLDNLGNTCFMNSALQCLSNVNEVSEYFLSNRYEQDINEENVLNTKGDLARAYANLIQQLWSGIYSRYSPRKFKAAIGQHFQQFSGYAQHDAQEFLSFLLDGLHEDLNRVKKKVYMEAKDSAGRHDRVVGFCFVADEAWNMYKMSNDSIIVDYLHGQLKSKVVCPKCKLVSVTFDPFCFLSVPLPPKERISKISLTIVPFDVNRKWMKILFALINYKALVRLLDEDELICNSFMPPVRQIYAYQLNEGGSNNTNTNINNINTSGHRAHQQYPPLNIIQIRNVDSMGKDFLTTPLLMCVPSMATLNAHFINSKILPHIRKCFVVVGKTVMKTSAAKVDIKTKTSSSTFTSITSNPQVDTISDTVMDTTNAERIKAPIAANATVLTKSSNPQQTIDSFNAIPTERTNGHADENMNEAEDDGVDWERRETSNDTCKPTAIKYSAFNSTDERMENIDAEKENIQEKEVSVKQSVRKSITVTECIDLFTREELLSTNNLWYCPHCKEHQRATKKLDLWRLPPILIVHMKRFTCSGWTREKIDIPIKFPLTGLDLTDRVVDKRFGKFVYDLIAVSNHSGGLGGGHYTTIALNNNNWYSYNDSFTSVINEPSNVSREAYMLLYRR